jgi:hypothetical protein
MQILTFFKKHLFVEKKETRGRKNSEFEDFWELLNLSNPEMKQTYMTIEVIIYRCLFVN